jgi:hypothetical protein
MFLNPWLCFCFLSLLPFGFHTPPSLNISVIMPWILWNFHHSLPRLGQILFRFLKSQGVFYCEVTSASSHLQVITCFFLIFSFIISYKTGLIVLFIIQLIAYCSLVHLGPFSAGWLSLSWCPHDMSHTAFHIAWDQ